MSSASLPPSVPGNRPQRPDAHPSALLDEVLGRFGCATGTIHLLDSSSGLLQLCAHRGVPEELLARVCQVQVGKGLAGLAAQRGEPVRVCNLQDDTTGMARPAAKQTGMAGAIAVPMLVQGQVRGVLGVAKSVAHEFNAAETADLLAAASAIGAALDGERSSGRQ